MKTKINTEDIFELDKKRRAFNKLDLLDIDFYEDGKRIKISKQIIDEFRFIGLNNIDFITSGFYQGYVMRKL